LVAVATRAGDYSDRAAAPQGASRRGAGLWEAMPTPRVRWSLAARWGGAGLACAAAATGLPRLASPSGPPPLARGIGLAAIRPPAQQAPAGPQRPLPRAEHADRGRRRAGRERPHEGAAKARPEHRAAREKPAAGGPAPVVAPAPLAGPVAPAPAPPPPAPAPAPGASPAPAPEPAAGPGPSGRDGASSPGAEFGFEH